MKKKLHLIFLLNMSFFSCSLLSVEKTLENKVFADYNCGDYITRAQDQNFSLRHFAGLRALQACKTEKPSFSYDVDSIPSWQKRLFANELPENNTSMMSTSELSTDDIRFKIKKEKNPKEKLALYKNLRQKLRNSGKRQAAIKMTEEILSWAEKLWKKNKKDSSLQAIYQEALLIRVRLLWNENRNKDSLKLIALSKKNLKPLKQLADFYFLEGRIQEDLKNTSAALAAYKRAMDHLSTQTVSPTLFDKEKLTWIQAWMNYQNKNWSQSAEEMQKLSELVKETGEVSRSLFFQARSLENLDKKEEAKKIYEKIIADDFYSFYALASYNRLNRKLPALTKLTPQMSLPIDAELSFMNDEQRGVFRDLIKHGEIDYAERSIPFFTSKNNEVFQLGLELAQTGQRYLPLFASFARLPNADKMDAVIRFGDYLFPRIHEEEVLKMSEKTEIPTSLIYAIMKQESAFNEKSRSGADALGLMQVIPALAKNLSKKYQVSYSTPEDLYNPIINIRLGTLELKDQVSKQKGQLTFVAAAYNAGPNALARWIKEHSTDDIFEFIENIPYDETRSYVKIIARNKLFYERIKNKDQEQDFPASFLFSLNEPQ
jgi:soluble lytic murein transglycosylase